MECKLTLRTISLALASLSQTDTQRDEMEFMMRDIQYLTTLLSAVCVSMLCHQRERRREGIIFDFRLKSQAEAELINSQKISHCSLREKKTLLINIIRLLAAVADSLAPNRRRNITKSNCAKINIQTAAYI